MLLVGTILVRDPQAVTAALSAMGLSDDVGFVNCHRVLQRAVSSSLAVSRALLHVLVLTFVYRESC